ALAGLVLAVAGGAAWIVATRPVGMSPPRPAPRPGAAVAMVGLNNLARDPGDAWIGPAVTELLGTDLALDGRARTVPDEMARAAAGGLAGAGAGGYGPSSLALIRRRSGADYVISGSYLVFADTGGERALRLDFAVQDARGGATLATLTRSGPVSGLPALTGSAAADLRRALGLEPASGAETTLAAAGPPSAEVMRHMGFGLKALHEQDPARARDEFIEATVEAPAYAPAYADLAEAWSALGYQAKALAAAEQAAAHSSGLPRTLRLQIDVQRAKARFDWPAAIAGLRTLIGLRPRDPEYRLRLVDTYLAAGKLDEAGAALGALRGLGGAIVRDPRLELAAAKIAAARDDLPARAAHAATALDEARATASVGLAAEAETELGIAKTGVDSKAAGAFLQEALVDYRRAANPRGEAWARQNLGNLLADTDPPAARAAYQRALAQYQSIGDEDGAAKILSDLAIMLWSSGDRDGAAAADRQVLQIRRKTGDPVGQAWALSALGVIESDEAASDEAITELRQAIALDQAAGARSHLAFTLYSLADDLRLRGELAEARRTCASADTVSAALPDPALRAEVEFECAQIDLDLGNLGGAEAGLKRARVFAANGAGAMNLGNIDLLQGQIAVGQKEWPAAAARFAAAESQYAGAEMTAGQVGAASLLAVSDAMLGRAQDRDRAAGVARRLRGKVTEREEVIQADIAMAQLRGLSGQREQAVAMLEALAEDARRRRWLSWSLEAKLAAVELTGPGAPGSEARRRRDDLAAEARALGFGWILKRLG
ncbi:MAG: tetratricopeptide repeat protein, partial [Caulobacteraceae bacterium]